jgi:hypothetical protein
MDKWIIQIAYKALRASKFGVGELDSRWKRIGGTIMQLKPSQ